MRGVFSVRPGKRIRQFPGLIPGEPGNHIAKSAVRKPTVAIVEADSWYPEIEGIVGPALNSEQAFFVNTATCETVDLIAPRPRKFQNDGVNQLGRNILIKRHGRNLRA